MAIASNNRQQAPIPKHRAGHAVLINRFWIEKLWQKKKQRVREAGNGSEKPFDDRQRDDAGQRRRQARRKNWRASAQKTISSRGYFRTPRDLRERKLSGKAAQQAVFLPLHFAPQIRLQIVMAKQMQNAVDDVTDNFRLPDRLELLCLHNRFIHANKNFAAAYISVFCFLFSAFPNSQT